MKRNVLLVCLLVLAVAPAGAWGARGHHAGGDVAAPRPAAAMSERSEVPHTVTWWCVDLNDLWNLDVPVITGRVALTAPDPSPLPPCATTSTFPIQVPTGSRFSAGGTASWTMHRSYTPEIRAALATAGYPFVSNSPHEDLMKKIVEVRTEIWSADFTELLRAYSFDPRKVFALVRNDKVIGALEADPIVDPALGIDLSANDVRALPTLHFGAVAGPLDLPPGPYIAAVVWVLDGIHNDGLGLADGNFLSGEFIFVANRFEVVP